MKLSNLSPLHASQAARRRRYAKVIQSILILIVVGMCYLSISDQEGHIAQAASPEPLQLKPAIRPGRENTLLATNSALDNSLNLSNININKIERQVGATTFPIPSLEPVSLSIFKDSGRVSLKTMPSFTSEFGNRYAARTSKEELVYYTLEPDLQKYVTSLVAKSTAPHIAAIAMDPRSGRVLAIADRSTSIQHLALHAGFPAASLFKVITASAAVERANLNTDTKISFRGGTYTLEPWNYLPDLRKDRFTLSLGDALGRSCNPVFGRVALSHLSPSVLAEYSKLFGFNRDLQSDLPLASSKAEIPDDGFGLSRTGAGFGEVRISPVHAAALMAGISNGGILPRPKIVEKVISENGTILYEADNDSLQRIVEADTAQEVMRMMVNTTTSGTSRKEFMRKGTPIMKDVTVAGKTGTLRGTDPVGLNTWFIGAAPLNNPQIAVAVIVVNPTAQTKASRIGRQIIEKHLFGTVTDVAPLVVRKSFKKSTKRKVSYKKSSVKKPVVSAKKKSVKKTVTLKSPAKVK
jgi:penicillin-binding protein A